MINGIAAAPPPDLRVNNAPPPRATPPSQSNRPIEDTVQLSSRALASLAAKPAEAMETAAQTQAEAVSGDPVALAKLAARNLG
jgi:hypothetical protein